MANVLAHRGPDGEGSFAAEPGVAFGHRRLAIIDLSDAGIQPFASDDGRLQLAAQRRDLQLPRAARTSWRAAATASAPRPTRRSCCTRTRSGATAASSASTACGRSRSGTAGAAALLLARPLRRQAVLLPLDDGRLRVRERAEGVPRRLGSDAAGEPRRGARLRRAGLRSTTRDETFFAGIGELPPAHIARRSTATGCATSATGSSRREPRRRPGRRGARAVPRLACGSACAATSRSARASRAASTRRRSRARSTTCSRPRPRTRGRSAIDSRRSRRTSSERASTSVRSRARSSRRRRPSRTGSRSATRTSSRPAGDREAQDEPFGSTSIVAQWYVMRAAREAGLKVMLDGQGGDEVLAGYPRTSRTASPTCSPRGRLASSAASSPRTVGSTALGAALAEAMLRPLGLRAHEAASARAAQGLAPGSREPATRRTTAASVNGVALPRLPAPPHAADPDRARPARAAALRGPQLHGALPRSPRALPRLPAGRAAVLAPGLAADRPRRHEGRAPARARRPPAAASCATGSTSSGS